MVKNLNAWGWMIGGFLVGFGTKMGKGCSSNFSVCGLPILSLRSIIATLIYFIVGVSVANFRYYVPFLYGGETYHPERKQTADVIFSILAMSLFFGYLLLITLKSTI